MFSTYARARGRGELVLSALSDKSQDKGLFTRRSEISSLSSLSSLKGCFPLKDQGFGNCALARFILPDGGFILPILPDFWVGNQHAVTGFGINTTSWERGVRQ